MRCRTLLRNALAASMMTGALALAGCGETGDPPAPAMSGTMADTPSATAAPLEIVLPTGVPTSSLGDPVILPEDMLLYAVAGNLVVGGREWDFPGARSQLQTCEVYNLSSLSPTVIANLRTTLDQSAGDHFSFAYDGAIIMGGAFSHGTGEEWAWSGLPARVSLQSEVEGFTVIHLFVEWGGTASENFSSERSTMRGWVACTFVSRQALY